MFHFKKPTSHEKLRASNLMVRPITTVLNSFEPFGVWFTPDWDKTVNSWGKVPSRIWEDRKGYGKVFGQFLGIAEPADRLSAVQLPMGLRQGLYLTINRSLPLNKQSAPTFITRNPTLLLNDHTAILSLPHQLNRHLTHRPKVHSRVLHPLWHLPVRHPRNLLQSGQNVRTTIFPVHTNVLGKRSSGVPQTQKSLRF